VAAPLEEEAASPGRPSSSDGDGEDDSGGGGGGGKRGDSRRGGLAEPLLAAGEISAAAVAPPGVPLAGGGRGAAAAPSAFLASAPLSAAASAAALATAAAAATAGGGGPGGAAAAPAGGSPHGSGFVALSLLQGFDGGGGASNRGGSDADADARGGDDASSDGGAGGRGEAEEASTLVRHVPAALRTPEALSTLGWATSTPGGCSSPAKRGGAPLERAWSAGGALWPAARQAEEGGDWRQPLRPSASERFGPRGGWGEADAAAAAGGQPLQLLRRGSAGGARASGGGGGGGAADGPDGGAALSAVPGAAGADDAAAATAGARYGVLLARLWPVASAAFGAASACHCLFPFFTFVPHAPDGRAQDDLPVLLFWMRVFADLSGRALPRVHGLKAASPAALLPAVAVLGASAAALLAYLKAPPAWRLDAVPLLLVGAAWTAGGYINTSAYVLAPGLAPPALVSEASALMALVFQCSHFFGLFMSVAFAWFLFGENIVGG